MIASSLCLHAYLLHNAIIVDAYKTIFRLDLDRFNAVYWN